MNIVRLMLLSRQMKNRRHEKDNMVTGIPPLTFTANKTGLLKNYRIYGNTVDGENVGNRVTDSHSEHYGKYAIPVTTNSETANIFLDEPLRMVGDEAEYIDYAEQKLHRVRKNLLNDKLSLNASLGTLASEPPTLGFPYAIGGDRKTCFLTVAPGEQYTISMSTPGDRLGICGYYNIVAPHEYTLENKLTSDEIILPIMQISLPSTYTFTVPNNVVMVAIYYSLYIQPTQFQIEKGSTATPYEPYIENTEVDVILPGIAVTAGTNTLTVGTEVQPSRVELTGRIKEGES